MKLFLLFTVIPIFLFAGVKNTFDNSMKDKPSTSTLKINSKDYQKLAKIKMSDAILIAQSKSAGRLVESSLESKNNFLIYSLTFSELDKSLSKFKIDAGTGNILDTEKQSNTEL